MKISLQHTRSQLRLRSARLCVPAHAGEQLVQAHRRRRRLLLVLMLQVLLWVRMLELRLLLHVVLKLRLQLVL